MHVSSSGGTITPQLATTTSNAPVTLPLGRRHDAIHYENGDGTAGCIAFPVNYEQLYNLKGRLLTLIDATYTDPQQRKAQKDIVWQALQAWMRDIEQAGGYNSAHPTTVGAYDEQDAA